MLSKDKAFKYARISKFVVGWGSHLYYWVYPGVMVAVTGVFVGYVVGFLYPNLHERLQSRTALYVPSSRCLLLLRGLDRLQGRRRLLGRQHRHKCDSDFGADDSSACWLLATAPIIPPARLVSSTTRRRSQTYTYQFATSPKDGSIMRDASGTPLPLLDKSASRFRSSSRIRRLTPPATS